LKNMLFIVDWSLLYRRWDFQGHSCLKCHLKNLRWCKGCNHIKIKVFQSMTWMSSYLCRYLTSSKMFCWYYISFKNIVSFVSTWFCPALYVNNQLLNSFWALWTRCRYLELSDFGGWAHPWEVPGMMFCSDPQKHWLYCKLKTISKNMGQFKK
jgi:hypothetical protein